MYASNSHSYTHLILALGIVRKPTVWVFITSKYPGTHDIGLPTAGQGEWQAPGSTLGCEGFTRAGTLVRGALVGFCAAGRGLC